MKVFQARFGGRKLAGEDAPLQGGRCGRPHSLSAGAASLTGKVSQAPPGSSWGEALALALDADGKLLVAGTAQLGGALSLPFNVAQFEFAWVVSRYNTDGTLDTSFGDFGYTFIRFGDNAIAATDDECTAVKVLASGKILLAGIRTNRTGSPAMNVAVARLNSDGTLDQTFGVYGQTNFAAGGSSYFAAVRLGVQSTGRIVLGTTEIIGGLGRFQAWRTTVNGVRDTTFTGGLSGTGTRYNDTKSSNSWAMLVDANDKIVMAGDGATGTGTQEGWFVARFNANGSVDTTFGGAGVDLNGVLTLFAQNTGNTAYAVLALAGGKYLVAGASGYDASGRQQVTLGQLTGAGALDTANFGSGTGLVSTDLHAAPGLNPNQSCQVLAVLSSGQIVVAGTSVGDSGGGFSDTGKFLSLRYNADGTLDTSYGTSGRQVPSLGTTSEVFYGGAADAAGKWYAGGHAMDDASSPRRAVATFYRFLTDGTPDPAYGDAASPPALTAPTATTGSASGVTTTGATLGGTVNPQGAATSYHFDYGLTADYGYKTPDASAGSGSSGAAVSASVTGLLSGKTYHWRLAASNGKVTLGADATFTTAAGGVNTLLSCPFTAPDGTLLEDYAPDVNNTGGGFFQAVFGAGSITGNKVVGTGDYAVKVTTGVLDCTAQGTFTWGGTGAVQMTILLRVADASNYWAVWLDGTNFKIVERVGGGNAVRATAAQSIASGTPYTVRVVVSGASITATVNGGNQISYGSVASLTGNLTAGFELYQAGVTLDDFSVTTP